MLQTIRPKQILRLPILGETCRTVFPSGEITEGQLTTIETMCLMAIAHHVKPRVVFEFGTFLGRTAADLALNTGLGAKIYTLDRLTAGGDGEDAHLAELALENGNPFIEGLQPEHRNKITRLIGDSREFDTHAHGLRGHVDLCFIDGGHDYETAFSDTEKAMEMRSVHGVIVWHDYGNPKCPDITGVVGRFAENESVYHIGDTFLAFTHLST
jgi:Methyltransferase domain